jgi:hypothetical protein
MNKLSRVYKKAISLGATDLKLSNQKNKKYMVLYRNNWIHFGQKGSEDFLDHNDKARRENYRKRARGIKDKDGRRVYRVKTSPAYWSYNVLWT